MSKFGKSPYYQTAIERHREMFREDVAKMLRKRPTGTRRVAKQLQTKWARSVAPEPKRQGTIQAMEY